MRETPMTVLSDAQEILGVTLFDLYWAFVELGPKFLKQHVVFKNSEPNVDIFEFTAAIDDSGLLNLGMQLGLNTGS